MSSFPLTSGRETIDPGMFRLEVRKYWTSGWIAHAWLPKTNMASQSLVLFQIIVKSLHRWPSDVDFMDCGHRPTVNNSIVLVISLITYQVTKLRERERVDRSCEMRNREQISVSLSEIIWATRKPQPYQRSSNLSLLTQIKPWWRSTNYEARENGRISRTATAIYFGWSTSCCCLICKCYVDLHGSF